MTTAGADTKGARETLATTPVDDTFDVAVVGGGPAGAAAALSASAAGARVLLLDPSDILGGNASNAFVHTICGLFETDADEPRLAQRGLAGRIARELGDAGQAGAPERAGRVYYLPIDPAGFGRHLTARCSEARGIELRLQTRLVGLALGGASETGRLLLDGPRGRTACAARLVVDASGDAVATSLAGGEVLAESGARRQRPSLVFRLRGVEADALEGFARVRISHAVVGGIRDGALPEGCESVGVRAGVAPGDAFVTLTLGLSPEESLALADLGGCGPVFERGRALARVVADFLRSRDGFANAAVAAWPRRLGVREGPRVRGRCEITGQDVLEGRRRNDEVAVSTWPIELWADHRRARFEFPSGPCSVPLGALVARGSSRLAMAGRCLSASHSALGALRVIGTSIATGEAAGVAAALAAERASGLDAIAPADVRAKIDSVRETDPWPRHAKARTWA